MRLHSITKFVSPEAQAAFDRASFLFEASERANAAGFFDTAADLANMGLKLFNESRDLEARLNCIVRFAHRHKQSVNCAN